MASEGYAPNFVQSEIFNNGQPVILGGGPLRVVPSAGQVSLSILNPRHKLYFYAEAFAYITNAVSPSGPFPSYITAVWSFTRSSNPVARFTFTQTYTVQPQASIASLPLANAQTPNGITILWPLWNNSLIDSTTGGYNIDGYFAMSTPAGPLNLVPATRFEAAADLASLSIETYGVFAYRIWWGVLSN